MSLPSLIHRPSVLVLNRCWQAIDVKTPAEAFPLMATGAARGLDISPDALQPVSWRDWLLLPLREQDAGIGIPRGRVRAPTVIVLTRFARMPRRRLTFSRRGLWLRDGGVCQYTGHSLTYEDANIDHIVPRCRGGPTTWENCVLTDRRVNHRKADRTPEEAGLQLRRLPSAPREMPASAFIRNTAGFPDWDLFLTG